MAPKNIKPRKPTPAAKKSKSKTVKNPPAPAVRGKLHVMTQPTHAKATAIVATKPDATLAGLPASFHREAERSDRKIVATIERIGKDYLGLGMLFDEAREKGYHVAHGFQTFTAYIEDRMTPVTGGKAFAGKTQVFGAMRVVRELASGDNPKVSTDDLRSMPQENAQGLASLSKKGVTITQELVQKAKDMPTGQFKDQVVHPVLPKEAQRSAVASGTHIPHGDQSKMRKFFLLSPAVAAQLERTRAIVAYVKKEGIPETGISDDDFISILCAEFDATHAPEYEEHLKDEEAEGVHNARTHAAGMTDDEDDEDIDDDDYDDDDNDELLIGEEFDEEDDDEEDPEGEVVLDAEFEEVPKASS